MGKRKKNDNTQKTLLTMSKKDAEERLNKQIEMGNQIRNSQPRFEKEINDLENQENIWSEFNFELLKRMFNTTEIAEEYRHAYSGGQVVPYDPFGGSSFPVMKRNFYSRIETKQNKLESIKERLELIPEATSEVLPSFTHKESKVIDSRKVFIVHGHDEETKQSVARFIEKLDLEAVILHEQPNKGRTIINKFEDYAKVGFAVVLLTPDDVGSSKSEQSELKSRARQNVIFELGFFIGLLGAERVSALCKGEIELPSDYQGVLWIQMNSSTNWQFKLAKELKAVGFDIDLNKLI